MQCINQVYTIALKRENYIGKKYHAMKVYRELKFKFHTFLILALGGLVIRFKLQPYEKEPLYSSMQEH